MEVSECRCEGRKQVKEGGEEEGGRRRMEGRGWEGQAVTSMVNK